MVHSGEKPYKYSICDYNVHNKLTYKDICEFIVWKSLLAVICVITDLWRKKVCNDTFWFITTRSYSRVSYAIINAGKKRTWKDICMWILRVIYASTDVLRKRGYNGMIWYIPARNYLSVIYVITNVRKKPSCKDIIIMCVHKDENLQAQCNNMALL